MAKLCLQRYTQRLLQLLQKDASIFSEMGMKEIEESQLKTSNTVISFSEADRSMSDSNLIPRFCKYKLTVSKMYFHEMFSGSRSFE